MLGAAPFGEPARNLESETGVGPANAIRAQSRASVATSNSRPEHWPRPNNGSSPPNNTSRPVAATPSTRPRPKPASLPSTERSTVASTWHVQRPASYLTEILGKRLRGDTEGRGWDKAARSIETYRHHHLGISPEHGSRPGDGIHKAIGEPPTNHTLRLRFWKQTQRHVDEHLSPSPERDNALQRTRSTCARSREQLLRPRNIVYPAATLTLGPTPPMSQPVCELVSLA